MAIKILLLGAQGQLGWELGGTLGPLGDIIALSRKQADLTDLPKLSNIVKEINPQVIVNAAAYTQVDKAESEPSLAHIINAQAPELLANLAKETGAWLVHYSTDYVFDGTKDSPYTEDDAPSPLNAYGCSKLAGDQAIMASGCRHLIFRTSWVYSMHGHSFPKAILTKAKQEKTLSVVSDQVGSPTCVEFLAGATVLALKESLLAENNLSGLYNLVSSGYVSWHEYAVYLVSKAQEAGWELLAHPENIASRLTDKNGPQAQRPANSRLNTTKFRQTFGLVSPPWQYYAQRFLDRAKF